MVEIDYSKLLSWEVKFDEFVDFAFCPFPKFLSGAADKSVVN